MADTEIQAAVMRVLEPYGLSDAAQPSVNDIADAELLRRAVLNARDSTRKHPRWVGVMHAFSLGSTYAHQLCRRFGIDPYEEVRRGR